MFETDRAQTVRRLIAEHVRSPSLRHIRDHEMIGKLVGQIMKAIDHEPSVWRKWQGQRDGFIETAAPYWIPAEDLRDFLNGLPGPALTTTDVEQRVRAVNEAPYATHRDEDLRPGCEALYQREKADGTELAAIVGALEDHVYLEGARLQAAKAAARQQQLEEERLALEARFLAGADSKWIAIQKSAALYCRKNGRAFRLTPTKDKRFELARIQSVEDAGSRLGVYGSRSDANKALDKLAYETEPRW